jgi:hypothetical protein
MQTTSFTTLSNPSGISPITSVESVTHRPGTSTMFQASHGTSQREHVLLRCPSTCHSKKRKRETAHFVLVSKDVAGLHAESVTLSIDNVSTRKKSRV